jgi:hypothetical protein
LKCLLWPTLLVVIHPHTELEILVYVLPVINKRFCFQMTATQHKKAETELEAVWGQGGGEGLECFCFFSVVVSIFKTPSEEAPFLLPSLALDQDQMQHKASQLNHPQDLLLMEWIENSQEPSHTKMQKSSDSSVIDKDCNRVTPVNFVAKLKLEKQDSKVKKVHIT